MKRYKDTGDRVVIKNAKGYGWHGVVLSNDGYGEVVVLIDGLDKLYFRGYEGRDLIYEGEELPPPVVTEGSLKPQIWTEIFPDGTIWKLEDLLGGSISSEGPV